MWSSNLMPSPWGSQRHRGLIRKSSDLSSWESGPPEQSFKGELLRLLTHPSHRAHQQVNSGGVRAGPGAWESSHARHPFCPSWSSLLSINLHILVPSCLWFLLCPLLLCPPLLCLSDLLFCLLLSVRFFPLCLYLI